MTTTFDVAFRPSAKKAFDRLGTADQRQLAAKLNLRRSNPRVPADTVREIPDGYKLRLRSSGIRLIYQVQDSRLVILVLAVGKREREKAYKDAIREFRSLSE